MKILAGLMATAFLFPSAAKSEAILTPESIRSGASLSGPSLRGAKVSPDGTLITVLKGRQEDSRQLDLWAYDTNKGKARLLVSSTELVSGDIELSEEEQNRRERQRDYDDGITSYAWDEQGRQILFPLGGEIFLYNLAKKKSLQVTDTEDFETDAKFSPRGGFISYVRDDDIYVYDIAVGREYATTSGGDGTVRNGVAEFVVQEEFLRFTGYWWSPDETLIAFTQIDESPVPIVERVQINADTMSTIKQRYPFAGANNVTIKLGVSPVSGGEPTWVDLGGDPDIYVARVNWSNDSAKLYVQRLSRDQKRLDLLEADPATGATRTLFSETSNTWINVNDDFKPLTDGGFLWGSERSGMKQIYRYTVNGDLVGVTNGPGLVDELQCVDIDSGVIFYAGWRQTPVERHLFSVPLEGGETTQLSSEAGWHGATYSSNCKTAIWNFSSDDQPGQVSVRNPDGALKFWLLENAIDRNHPYWPYRGSHEPWRYGSLKAPDGTPLDYKILVPRGKKQADTMPAIILVYGGPTLQRVRNRWANGPLFAQMLVDEGYVVFRLDNRGATNRGTAFENPLYRAMGTVEVEDQAIGAAYLKSLPFVDPDRIGVFGWSYGGYMVLRMLTSTPDLYAAGIAGAPVTDWSLYDTAYTERYMGKPDEETEAYARGSALADLEQLKGKLLVVHGMADDNVIFQNSVKLMHELQLRNKMFELMTYPGEKHYFRRQENIMHLDRLTLDFFERHLRHDNE